MYNFGSKLVFNNRIGSFDMINVYQLAMTKGTEKILKIENIILFAVILLDIDQLEIVIGNA